VKLRGLIRPFLNPNKNPTSYGSDVESLAIASGLARLTHQVHTDSGAAPRRRVLATRWSSPSPKAMSVVLRRRTSSGMKSAGKKSSATRVFRGTVRLWMPGRRIRAAWPRGGFSSVPDKMEQGRPPPIMDPYPTRPIEGVRGTTSRTLESQS
jgi:hypothetical protein